jgi:dynactin-6
MTTDNLICEGAFLQGNIILGHGNVLHPRSEIKSNNGPIVIGNDNIFEEQVLIENEYYMLFDPLVTHLPSL